MAINARRLASYIIGLVRVEAKSRDQLSSLRPVYQNELCTNNAPSSGTGARLPREVFLINGNVYNEV